MNRLYYGDKPRAVKLTVIIVIALAVSILTHAQEPEGLAAFHAFERWRNEPANTALDWNAAIDRYREHLLTQGLSPERADRLLRLLLAYDEGTLYDKVYAAEPQFQTTPNRLLMEVVGQLKPGKALDVGMGQGRNALALAERGWNVTGFDVSAVGIEKAKVAAQSAGLKICAVHASDEEFEFGREEWDLIAILYALEKRSVFRARNALRHGGIVIVEGAHRDASGADWEFESNELLQIFEGFKILRYEELVGSYDWAPGKPVRMVRLVAQKPSAVFQNR